MTKARMRTQEPTWSVAGPHGLEPGTHPTLYAAYRAAVGDDPRRPGMLLDPARGVYVLRTRDRTGGGYTPTGHGVMLSVDTVNGRATRDGRTPPMPVSAMTAHELRLAVGWLREEHTLWFNRIRDLLGGTSFDPELGCSPTCDGARTAWICVRGCTGRWDPRIRAHLDPVEISDLYPTPTPTWVLRSPRTAPTRPEPFTTDWTSEPDPDTWTGCEPVTHRTPDAALAAFRGGVPDGAGTRARLDHDRGAYVLETSNRATGHHDDTGHEITLSVNTVWGDWQEYGASLPTPVDAMTTPQLRLAVTQLRHENTRYVTWARDMRSRSCGPACTPGCYGARTDDPCADHADNPDPTLDPTPAHTVTC
ncbi:hypothetical protein [Embleya sp. NPDC050493]|uniref:hypothetical protein n=1 Tax=Embleya sp. NPDC050493 TaxID=3363989 RepID=UPI00379FA4AC